MESKGGYKKKLKRKAIWRRVVKNSQKVYFYIIYTYILVHSIILKRKNKIKKKRSIIFFFSYVTF